MGKFIYFAGRDIFLKLSIIIVNYNVRSLLEQCLHSVQHTTGEKEVIVIDNHSTDGSREFFPQAFPEIQFIWNKENMGFGKACNQGASLAKGDYLLFLNPDTVIPEDCLENCFNFFAEHPDAGALGIKMLDSDGNFLKESKRSFPSPLTSFYKLSGLSLLFPKSKVFSRYHLAHLDKDKDHPVPILCGAFMMMPKKIFTETGGFDERFFMYAEDIDLSHRIMQAGYQNYYIGASHITHLKGKSTPRDLKYVKHFYKAMALFAEKYYGKKSLKTFFLKTAIVIRASLSYTGILIKRIIGHN